MVTTVKSNHDFVFVQQEAELVEEMFRDRARLHRHGYQHRVTKIIDRMMVSFFVDIYGRCTSFWLRGQA